MALRLDSWMDYRLGSWVAYCLAWVAVSRLSLYMFPRLVRLACLASNNNFLELMTSHIWALSTDGVNDLRLFLKMRESSLQMQNHPKSDLA